MLGFRVLTSGAGGNLNANSDTMVLTIRYLNLSGIPLSVGGPSCIYPWQIHTLRYAKDGDDTHRTQ